MEQLHIFQWTISLVILFIVVSDGQNDDEPNSSGWPVVDIGMQISNQNGMIKKIPFYDQYEPNRPETETANFYGSEPNDEQNSANNDESKIKKLGVDYSNFYYATDEPSDDHVVLYSKDTGNEKISIVQHVQPTEPPQNKMFFGDEHATNIEKMFKRIMKDTLKLPKNAPREKHIPEQSKIGKNYFASPIQPYSTDYITSTSNVINQISSPQAKSQQKVPFFWNGKQPLNISIAQRDENNKTLFTYSFDPTKLINLSKSLAKSKQSQIDDDDEIKHQQSILRENFIRRFFSDLVQPPPPQIQNIQGFDNEEVPGNYFSDMSNLYSKNV